MSMPVWDHTYAVQTSILYIVVEFASIDVPPAPQICERPPFRHVHNELRHTHEPRPQYVVSTAAFCIIITAESGPSQCDRDNARPRAVPGAMRGGCSLGPKRVQNNNVSALPQL